MLPCNMGRILITWELGGGLGHVAVLRPVAESLMQRGHKVLLAVRDTKVAERAFSDTGIPFTQAPFKVGPVAKPFRPQRSFAHLLHNAGFADEDELFALCSAWIRLFDTFRPDVTIFDHSPTALLASRGRDMRRVLIGTGFCAPPARDYLPDMRPWLPEMSSKLQRDERTTLRLANRVLLRNKHDELDRLSDIYGQVDRNLLTTFPELDHFGARSDAEYWGTFQNWPGVSPIWPTGAGRRVFAYLKRSRGLKETIDALGASGHSVIIYTPWAKGDINSQLGLENVRLSAKPFDMTQVSKECDLAVLNGTHGTTAEVLLSGKPILQLPIYLEQRLIAERIASIGVGLFANCTFGSDVAEKLDVIARDSTYTSNAQKFSAKYSHHDGFVRFEEMSQSVSELAL